MEKLRTASLHLNFTGSYIQKEYAQTFFSHRIHTHLCEENLDPTIPNKNFMNGLPPVRCKMHNSMHFCAALKKNLGRFRGATKKFWRLGSNS